LRNRREMLPSHLQRKWPSMPRTHLPPKKREMLRTVT
jgi:hypothetical protein